MDSRAGSFAMNKRRSRASCSGGLSRSVALLKRSRIGSAAYIVVLIGVSLLSLTSISCARRAGGPAETGAKNPPGRLDPDATQREVAPGFPVRVKDQLGRYVDVPSKPQRIVSLAAGNTEILFALGAGSGVVGADEYSDYPQEAADIPRVGAYGNVSVEKIVALRPDLVLGTEADQNIVGKMDDLVIPTILLCPRSLEELVENVEIIGRLLAKEKEAKTLRAQMEERLNRVKEQYGSKPVERWPKVYYEVYSDPMMSVGPNTLIHHMIQAAAGRNVFADAAHDYPIVSAEAVIERNPDVIMFPEFHGTSSLGAEDFKSRPGWGHIVAVKKGQVFPINADIVSRPGPRVVDAVELMATMFCPQCSLR